MIRSILIHVPGNPKGQPRGRAVVEKTRKATAEATARSSPKARIVSVMDPKIAFWAECVSRAARAAAENLGGAPVVKEILGEGALHFQAVFRISTGNKALWGQWHVGTPDVDNLAKLAMDRILVPPTSPGVGLMSAGDQRVAGLTCWKVYCPPPQAGATFIVGWLDPALAAVYAG